MIVLIRAIFSDIASLYKNFFHWNISKLVYSIYGLLVGVALAVLPLLLFGILLLISDLDFATFASFLLGGGDSVLFMGSLLASPIASILAVIMLFCAAISVYFGVWYGSFLISWLSLKYVDHKLPHYFKKKRYLNTNRVKKFAAIIGWLFLLAGLLFLLYIILIIFTIALFGGISSVNEILVGEQNNIFSIITFFITAIFGLVFLYLAYRFSFAHLHYLDKNDQSIKGLDYIKKSYLFTSGWRKFMKFIGVFLLTAIILAPVSILDDHIKQTSQDLHVYGEYVLVETELGQEQLLAQLRENNMDGYEYYTLLDTKYAPMSLSEIKSSLKSYQVYNWLFNILYFLLIYGVLHMVLASFYIHVLKPKK